MIQGALSGSTAEVKTGRRCRSRRERADDSLGRRRATELSLLAAVSAFAVMAPSDEDSSARDRLLAPRRWTAKAYFGEDTRPYGVARGFHIEP